MKNPLLSVLALIALAGILFAQGPPSSTSAHSVVRQVELVGPIQVEGVVPMRDHISIEWTVSNGSPFYNVCCDDCNSTVVIPARLNKIFISKKEEQK
jgi:hypothetical protein